VRPTNGIHRGPCRTADPALTRNEKLKLQIMRVQIKLQRLGLYEGGIDGARTGRLSKR